MADSSSRLGIRGEMTHQDDYVGLREDIRLFGRCLSKQSPCTIPDVRE